MYHQTLSFLYRFNVPRVQLYASANKLHVKSAKIKVDWNFQFLRKFDKFKWRFFRDKSSPSYKAAGTDETIEIFFGILHWRSCCVCTLLSRELCTFCPTDTAFKSVKQPQRGSKVRRFNTCFLSLSLWFSLCFSDKSLSLQQSYVSYGRCKTGQRSEVIVLPIRKQP